MSTDIVVVQGTVNAAGMLELPTPVGLPPGTVEVIVRAVAVAQGEDILALLGRIRAEQQASGHRPRSREEIDAAVRQMRDEWEEHQLSVEGLQEGCRRDRDSNPNRESCG